MMFIADWFSTFITLAGGKHEQELPVDAIDMTGMLFGGKPSPRDEIIFEVAGSVRLPTIRSGDYKLMGDMLFNIQRTPARDGHRPQHPKIVKELQAARRRRRQGTPAAGRQTAADGPAPALHLRTGGKKESPRGWEDRREGPRRAAARVGSGRNTLAPGTRRSQCQSNDWASGRDARLTMYRFAILPTICWLEARCQSW